MDSNVNLILSLMNDQNQTLKKQETMYQELIKSTSLEEYFQKTMKELTDSQRVQVCSHLKYKIYKQGEVVFKQGTPSNNFLYIIIKGGVLVFKEQEAVQTRNSNFLSPNNNNNSNYLSVIRDSLISIPQLDTENARKLQVTSQIDEGSLSNSIENSPREQKMASKQISMINFSKILGQKNKRLSSNQSFGNLKSTNKFQKKKDDTESMVRTNLDLELLIKKYGRIERQVKVGHVFGERAFTDNEQVRTSTMVVEHNDSVILYLDVDYIKQQIDEARTQNRSRKDIVYDLFQSVNNLSSANFEIIYSCFQPELFQKGNYLFQQGRKGKRLYIIEKGEIQLMKSPQLPIQRSVDLALLTDGMLLGEEVLIEEYQQIYQYSAVVKSAQAAVLSASTELLKTKLPDFIYNQLVKNYQQKNNLRDEILKSFGQRVKRGASIEYDRAQQIRTVKDLEESPSRRDIFFDKFQKNSLDTSEKFKLNVFQNSTLVKSFGSKNVQQIMENITENHSKGFQADDPFFKKVRKQSLLHQQKLEKQLIENYKGKATQDIIVKKHNYLSNSHLLDQYFVKKHKKLLKSIDFDPKKQRINTQHSSLVQQSKSPKNNSFMQDSFIPLMQRSVFHQMKNRKMLNSSSSSNNHHTHQGLKTESYPESELFTMKNSIENHPLLKSWEKKEKKELFTYQSRLMNFKHTRERLHKQNQSVSLFQTYTQTPTNISPSRHLI